MTPVPPLRPSEIWRYGALGLPLAFAALPVYVHVPRLYAEVSGLDLALLGGLLLLARLFDAVIDPLLGWLADRLSRLRMMFWSLWPLAAGFALLMHPPVHSAGIWLLFSLLLTFLGFSALSVAYQAWGADLGQDAGERTRLTAVREGLGLLGVVCAASLPSLLAPALADGLARLVWVFLPVLAIASFLSLSVRRAPHSQPIRQPPPQEGLPAALRQTLSDPAFSRLLAVYVVSGIAAALPATLVLFFVADVLQAEKWSGAFLALYFLAGVAGVPLWVRLAACLGRLRAWLAGMLVAVAAFAGTFLLGAGDIVAYIAVCLATGLALGSDLVLPTALAADLGERMGRAGICFGLWSFVSKLNLALAAGLALPLLDALGYVPGSQGNLLALSAVYAVLPLLFKLLAAGLLWHWRNRLESLS